MAQEVHQCTHQRTSLMEACLPPSLSLFIEWVTAFRMQSIKTNRHMQSLDRTDLLAGMKPAKKKKDL
jgi:hypothetical protein